jgi:hypothetical protein
MVAAGYHKHERTWRRRWKSLRALEDNTVKPPAPGKETDEMMMRAARGDHSVYPLVRAYLATPDRGAAFVATLGNMANHVRNKLIDTITSKDILLQEAFMDHLNLLQGWLAGPNPSPIEMVLAERAAICWLVVYRYEHIALNQHMTIPQSENIRRQVDSAHRRFVSTLVALARVRKLALPALVVAQINIAGQVVSNG